MSVRSSNLATIPGRIRIAAGFWFVQAIVSVFAGVSYWYLVDRPQISWWLTAVGVVVGAICVLIGIQLLRLRRGALLAGRILAVITVLGSISTLTSPHPGIVLVTAIRALLGVGVVIALFRPGTTTAFEPQPTRESAVSKG